MLKYQEGIEYIKELTKKKQEGSFEAYEGIVINYPGYKKYGDYRLTVRGRGALAHVDIVNGLYQMIMSGDYGYYDMKQFLIDIYQNGTDTGYGDLRLRYLQYLIFWMTLQEELNYPRPRYKGIRLPFSRYLEAIEATLPKSRIEIEDVKKRCNNHGRRTPKPYDIENAPKFYC